MSCAYFDRCLQLLLSKMHLERERERVWSEVYISPLSDVEFKVNESARNVNRRVSSFMKIYQRPYNSPA